MGRGGAGGFLLNCGLLAHLKCPLTTTSIIPNNNQKVALTTFPLVFLFLGSFAGFAIPLAELPQGWSWAAYVR